MKVIVINLEKSRERLKKITKNLNKLNIKFERFNAIYGKNLDNDKLKNNTTYIGRNFLCNHGIIGCAMSHIKIWRDFKASNDDFILISEDDIEYSVTFPIFLKSVNDIYNKLNFDILSLNCSVGINISKCKTQFINNYEITKPLFPLTMASYIVSKKGVDKLLNMISKVNYHIDFEIAFKGLFNNLEYYNVKTPRLLEVEQNSNSNISSYNNGILNKILNNIGWDKLNWLISNTAFTLFLNLSISVYACILLIIMVVSLLKKKYFIFCIASIEFILVLSPK